MSTIDELNEKDIIETYFNRSGQLPDHYHGIGDDCSVHRTGKRGDPWQLVTTDALIENCHFLMDRIDPVDLGYKSMAVNLSDIAAMAGQPVGAYISVALPGKLRKGWMQKFSDGIFDICNTWNIPVLGGDTVVSDQGLYISITITGKVDESVVRFRTGAQAGDVVCVTGTLGDSAAGLQIELNEAENVTQGPDRKARKKLVQRHYRPPITLDIGTWLGNRQEVNALMDISDGISSDLPEMIKDNSLGANIIREDIPLSDELRNFARNTGFSAYQLAEDGGEDYHLMFAVDSEYADELQHAYRERFGYPFYQIGSFTEEHRDVMIYQNQQRVRKNPSGFQHFIDRD